MRRPYSDKVERARIRDRTSEYSSDPGDPWGFFRLRLELGGTELVVIASDGDVELNVPWEHVSVSTAFRCPSWSEMCKIKDLFWTEEETVVQYHVPAAAHIQNHRYCLHLWRPMDGVMPMPPSIAVGIKELGELDTEAKRHVARQRIQQIMHERKK